MMRYFTITVNGVSYQVTVEENNAPAADPAAAPAAPAAPAAAPAAPAPAASAAPAASVAGTPVTAPIPGTVLSVRVKTGDKVKSGDVLCTLEAMKMENEICAPADGTVAAVHAAAGQAVEAGSPLLTIA